MRDVDRVIDDANDHGLGGIELGVRLADGWLLVRFGGDRTPSERQSGNQMRRRGAPRHRRIAVRQVQRLSLQTATGRRNRRDVAEFVDRFDDRDEGEIVRIVPSDFSVEFKRPAVFQGPL